MFLGGWERSRRDRTSVLVVLPAPRTSVSRETGTVTPGVPRDRLSTPVQSGRRRTSAQVVKVEPLKVAQEGGMDGARPSKMGIYTEVWGSSLPEGGRGTLWSSHELRPGDLPRNW